MKDERLIENLAMNMIGQHSRPPNKYGFCHVPSRVGDGINIDSSTCLMR